jgi:hypothetical protein
MCVRYRFAAQAVSALDRSLLAKKKYTAPGLTNRHPDKVPVLVATLKQSAMAQISVNAASSPLQADQQCKHVG